MLAENALTTVERMEMMLGLSDYSDEKTNILVAMLINRASSQIECQLGRHLGKHKYTQWYDANGQQELVTMEYPIVSIDYIKENGVLVDPSSYDFVQTADMGIIYRDDGWRRAEYRAGLAYDCVATGRNIEVCYTAGYVLPKDANENDPQTLPADIEGLLWDIVTQIYSNMQNGANGLSSFSIANVSWTFDKSVHSEWMQTINRYKRY